jgi:uncharacterized protein YrrD
MGRSGRGLLLDYLPAVFRFNLGEENMLRNVQRLIGNRIHATDGELGTVAEFYFDDETWTIRYMVVDTGYWLSGRKVLISPAALGTPDWESKTFPVRLTQEQIRNSPDIDTKQPVSRQHEVELSQYYRWPMYWESGFYPGAIFGMLPLFPMSDAQPVTNDEASTQKRQGDPHLRSTTSVMGYYIHATDGEIGHVADYIVDDETWILRFLLVDTRNWLPGKTVLLAPRSITRVEWADSMVYVNLSRESVKQSPEFDPPQLVSMGAASALGDHYIGPKELW